jgi:hypothetical protein
MDLVVEVITRSTDSNPPHNFESFVKSRRANTRLGGDELERALQLRL